jgi:2,4-dienoyl-CoA reductase-like NADH-dependent reductase (Old Yellow Enzyme family)
MMKTDYRPLFEPFQMNGNTIKNRFLRSPMESSLGEPGGSVTNDHIRMYGTAAAGGVGLLITEGIAIHPKCKMTDAQMTAFDDSAIPGFRKLTDAIHEKGDGVTVWAQLISAGAASFGYSYGQDDHGLDVNHFDKDLIELIIDSFANAAVILKKAGFDGVELHGGHGYLISQFLSPAVNQRTDRWGGSTEKRMEFPLEIYRRIRKKCGDDFPIGIKMNSADFLPSGNWLGDTVPIARRFAEVGFSLIEVSGGMGYMTELREALRKYNGDHQYYFKDAIPEFKEALAGTNTALCVTGGIGKPDYMLELLEAGADLIGLARPWLCEPDFANRLKAGDHRQVRCIARERLCNHCLTRLALGPVTCYKFYPGYCRMACPVDQNAPEYIGLIAEENLEEAYRVMVRDNPLPAVLCRVCDHQCELVCRGKNGEALAIRDLKRFLVDLAAMEGWERPVPREPAEWAAKAAIIGGGPAGLACALGLAQKGIKPVIFETTSKLGGMLHKIPSFKLPYDQLEAEINFTQRIAEVHYNMELGKNMSIDDLFQQGYGAIFLGCGGGSALLPEVPGIGLPGVVSGLDFLEQYNAGTFTAINSSAIVLGGGSVAVDAARAARRLGANVTIACLEQPDEMPAYCEELDAAIEEGVEILNGWGLSRVILTLTAKEGKKRPQPL